MAQVAVMNVDGSVNKIDRDSKESLDALRQLSALMLKAALQKNLPAFVWVPTLLKKTVFTLTLTKTNSRFPLTNCHNWKLPSRQLPSPKPRLSLKSSALKKPWPASRTTHSQPN
jgi:hypothetical protein